MPKRKWPRRGLQLALLLGVAFLAWRYIDFRALAEALLSVPPAGIAGLLLIATFDRWLMAYKWVRLCEAFTSRVRYRTCLRLYYAASFLNHCTPIALGGDVYRGVALARELPEHKQHVYVSLILEKLIGIFASILCAWGAALWLLPCLGEATRHLLLAALAGATALAVLFVLLSFHPGLHRRCAGLLRSCRLPWAAGLVDRAHRAYRDFQPHKTLLLENLFLAVCENVVQFSILFFAGAIVGVDVFWVDLLAIIAITQFVKRVSIYFNSWGFAEAVNVAMYTLVDIEPSMALAISLLRHAIQGLALMPGGLILWRSGLRVGAEPVHS